MPGVEIIVRLRLSLRDSYTAQVRWGTPQQSTYLMIDTGSWDVWAYSWLMDVYASFDLTGHNYYNATKSSTAAVMPNQTIEVCYGGVYIPTSNYGVSRG